MPWPANVLVALPEVSCPFPDIVDILIVFMSIINNIYVVVDRRINNIVIVNSELLSCHPTCYK